MNYEVNREECAVNILQTGGGWFPNYHGIEILHIPSGLRAQCTSERSQHANYAKAFEELKAAVDSWTISQGFNVANPPSATRVAFERWYTETHTSVNLTRSKKGYNSEVTRIAWRAWQASTTSAQDRIFDLLLDDDGQAHKEARRYLEAHRPDLYKRLTEAP